MEPIEEIRQHIHAARTGIATNIPVDTPVGAACAEVLEHLTDAIELLVHNLAKGTLS